MRAALAFSPTFRRALLFALVLVATHIHTRAEEPRLRVMAYNIKHGRGMDDKVSLVRAADVIRRAEPDLVALQEIDEFVPRSGKIDEAAELGKLTGMHHAFGSFFDYQGGRYGMAVLSRAPIIRSENHRLPDGKEPRTALAVTVRPPQCDRELVFVSVHFYQSEKERLAQADTLLKALKDETRPVIVAGDLNSIPNSPVLKRFSDWNIPAKEGNPFTVPADRPRAEIDFIMFRPADAFTPGKTRVLDEPLVSDHRPLLLDLSLPTKATD